MQLGRFILGQFVRVPVFTGNVPAAAPLLTVYTGTGTRIYGPVKMPPGDFYGVDGYFVLPVRLGSLFAVGRYAVAISYAAPDPTLTVARFEIVAGGDVDGAVTALTFYRRPHANFLVGRLDSDQRMLAKNPREDT